MKPVWLRIGGYWYPRGGMPIDVFWQTGAPPEGLWLPDQSGSLTDPVLALAMGLLLRAIERGKTGSLRDVIAPPARNR